MGARRSSQPLIEAVAVLVKEQFGKLGFKRREAGIFTTDLGAEFLGWVGLNRAVGRGEGWLQINPAIGVRCQPLERTLAGLQGVKWSSYFPATISKQLGYLMPQHDFLSWDFSVDADPAPTVEDMTRSIETHGIPFMKSNASLEAMVARLSTFEFTIRDSRSYRLPLAHLLRGDKEQALALVKVELERLGDAQGAGADFYRNYAKNLSELAHRE